MKSNYILKSSSCLFLTPLFLLLTSCESDPVIPVTEILPDIKISTDRIETLVDGGKFTVTVTEAPADWEIKNYFNDWIIAEKNGNELTIEIESNWRGFDRDGFIQIVADRYNPGIVNIKQTYNEITFDNAGPFTSEAQTVEIELIGTRNWDFECEKAADPWEDWFTITKNTDNSALVVELSANASQAARIIPVTVTTDARHHEEIIIIQHAESAENYIDVELTPVYFEFETEGVKILKVTSDIDQWTLSASEPWITTGIQKEGESIWIGVSGTNDTDSPRVGNVIIEAGDARYEIEVRQIHENFIPLFDLELPLLYAEMQEVWLSIPTNHEAGRYRVRHFVDWMEIIPDTESVRFHIYPNYTSAVRNGNATFYPENAMPYELRIIQYDYRNVK